MKVAVRFVMPDGVSAVVVRTSFFVSRFFLVCFLKRSVWDNNDVRDVIGFVRSLFS